MIFSSIVFVAGMLHSDFDVAVVIAGVFGVVIALKVGTVEVGLLGISVITFALLIYNKNILHKLPPEARRAKNRGWVPGQRKPVNLPKARCPGDSVKSPDGRSGVFPHFGTHYGLSRRWMHRAILEMPNPHFPCAKFPSSFSISCSTIHFHITIPSIFPRGQPFCFLLVNRPIPTPSSPPSTVSAEADRIIKTKRDAGCTDLPDGAVLNFSQVRHCYRHSSQYTEIAFIQNSENILQR